MAPAHMAISLATSASPPDQPTEPRPGCTDGASGEGGKRKWSQLTPSAAEPRSSDSEPRDKVAKPKRASESALTPDEVLSKENTPAATPAHKPLGEGQDQVSAEPAAACHVLPELRQLAEQMRRIIITASEHDEPAGPCLPSFRSSLSASHYSSCSCSSAPPRRLGIEEVARVRMDGCRLVCALAHQFHAGQVPVSMRTIMHAMLLVSARGMSAVWCRWARDRCVIRLRDHSNPNA